MNQLLSRPLSQLMLSYASTLTLTLAACFGLQSLALQSVGGRTNKSESNFFSSIARIQTGASDQPEIMLLGSSITGRLPDRSHGFHGVANLGCDGANAVDTLRAMDRNQLPAAPFLILEGNTLYRSVGNPRSEIATAITSPWFRIGSYLPNLGATARPAAFVYSRLLAEKIGEAGGGTSTRPMVSNSPGVPNLTPPALNEQESTLIAELAEIIERLEKRGTRFLITILPPGGKPESAHVRLPIALALRTRQPLWDLANGLPTTSIRFTDGVHMAPSSAAAVMSLLLENHRSK